jgi:hypothetical protein
MLKRGAVKESGRDTSRYPEIKSKLSGGDEFYLVKGSHPRPASRY